jgi:hypothetical protein
MDRSLGIGFADAGGFSFFGEGCGKVFKRCRFRFHLA